MTIILRWAKHLKKKKNYTALNIFEKIKVEVISENIHEWLFNDIFIVISVPGRKQWLA